MMQELTLGYQEKIVYKLRSLYSSYGYAQYKMSKFEEYDLYARNKDFLLSDKVITFMDTSGRLMALKPDVTLSIVKNTKDQSAALQKLYYNENVYRAANGTCSFREITQVGLECLGAVDDYCIWEVLLLAAKSLQAVSAEGILEISHLGMLSELIDTIGVPGGEKSRLLACIGQKNVHEAAALCRGWGITEENIQILSRLIMTGGKPKEVLPEVKALLKGIIDTGSIDSLICIADGLERSGMGEMLRFDFSVVDDIHYYNGILFKGFVPGIPNSVLSGGQYDKLLRKMYRKDGAIGFAVYMDTLERLDMQRKDYDVDTVVLYDTVDLDGLQKLVTQLQSEGKSVMVQRDLPEDIRYRQIVKLQGSEVQTLENNA